MYFNREEPSNGSVNKPLLLLLLLLLLLALLLLYVRPYTYMHARIRYIAIFFLLLIK